MREPSPLAEAPALETAWLGRAWRHVRECASTNDEAAAWARAGAPHGAVVVADAQTRGRGRLGRRWHSPPGESLYFSVVLRPPIEPARVPPITLAAGVAVAEAVAAAAELAPSLKWPNDVLAGGGRKLAGILTEMASQRDRVEHVVVGIGVNVNVAAFPDELAATATSLRLARAGREVDAAAFAATLCARLERWIDEFVARGAAPVVEAWRAYASFLGREIRVSTSGAPLTGRAEDIAPDGALLLRAADGRLLRIHAGEILDGC
jgi:BirA family transcriptional regulator, biotin operon repressor / biotin---[acetyl-CoA-carboxylase] ligase